MRNPAVFNPVLAGTLSDVAPIDPDVMVAAIGPVTRGPDVSVARGGGNDDSRGGWGNFDINNGRLGQ
jgi:hypothetical protein